jgi:predicted DNA-binding transcriptional regulator YafY
VKRRAFLRHAAAALLGLFAGVSRVAAAPTATDQIRAAITAKRSLRFTYAGHVRHVEPHALGLTPGGHRALIAWQFDGTSRQTPPTGWRTFLLSEMHDVRMTVRTFRVRPDYHRERLPLRRIEADVQPDTAEG